MMRQTIEMAAGIATYGRKNAIRNNSTKRSPGRLSRAANPTRDRDADQQHRGVDEGVEQRPVQGAIGDQLPVVLQPGHSAPPERPPLGEAEPDVADDRPQIEQDDAGEQGHEV